MILVDVVCLSGVQRRKVEVSRWLRSPYPLAVAQSESFYVSFTSVKARVESYALNLSMISKFEDIFNMIKLGRQEKGRLHSVSDHNYPNER